MSGSQPRGSSTPAWLGWLALSAGAACVLFSPAIASAWPLLPPRPVPSAIAGPTDPHPAASFYNPAALGPLRGVHLWFDAGARLQLGTYARDAGPAAQAGQTVPITSPAVDGFVGATWDVFTDRIVIGIAVFSPFNELTQYPEGSAARYQAIWQRGATLEEVFAVGIRLSSRFYVGAAANFAQSWIDYRFARDTAPAGGSAGIDQASARCGGMPCGLENPLATQDMRIRGFGWGIGFSVGILARPVDRVWLALSYISHVFDPFDGVDLPLGSDDGARVTGAPGAGNTGCGGPCIGRSRVTTYIPDILYLGIRIEATPRLEIEGTTRWVHYGARQTLDVYSQGGNLDRLSVSDTASAVPSQMRLNRGWQDTVSVGASVRARLGETVRLAPSLVYESNALGASFVSPANLEGHKLDLALTVEWRARPHLTIGAHVGATAYFVGHAGGEFDPRAEASCVDSGYALESCGKRVDGTALPSASGRYTMGAVHAGFALGMDY